MNAYFFEIVWCKYQRYAISYGQSIPFRYVYVLDKVYAKCIDHGASGLRVFVALKENNEEKAIEKGMALINKERKV